MNNIELIVQSLHADRIDSAERKRTPHAIPTQYYWLDSPITENTWTVRDPVAVESDFVANLNFDGPLIGGGMLSDIPDFIEDSKVSLILAVEMSGSVGMPKVSSLSRMQNHVNCVKRIYNELVAIGFHGWESWNPDRNKLLLQRLALKEAVSQKYLEKIQAYVDGVGVEALPISAGGKSPIRILSSKVYKTLGINRYAARAHNLIPCYWQHCHEELSKLHPDWTVEYRQELTNPESGDDKVNVKQFEYLLDTLKHLNHQATICPELFHDPWVVQIVTDRSEAISTGNFDTSTGGRTKNIPPPLFLEVMDAAARYVLDYSEPLFKIETELEKKLNELEPAVGNYQAGKFLNAEARRGGLKIGGKHTPFPLAAYKHFQERESCLSDDWWKDFEELVSAGVPSKDIREEFSLTKSQFDGRKQILNDLYDRNLPHTGISLQKALYQFLPVSCVLIIFAFSARREREVYGMKAGCYTETSLGWKINFFVEKSDRKHDWFVTVPLVIKAIKVLERISASARERNDTAQLMIFDDTFTGRDDRAQSRFTKCMDSFQKFLGIDAGEDGKYFEFDEHQFRRFFVMLFFYRYPEGKDLKVLMSELRHSSWEMLITYATERTQGAIFREMEIERISDYGFRAIEGSGLDGVMADELRELLQNAVRLVPEQRRKVALTAVKDASLCMDFITEGVCFGCTPSRALLSNCYEDGQVMMHKSSKKICDGCPNLLGVEEIRKDHSKVKYVENECGNSKILDSLIAREI